MLACNQFPYFSDTVWNSWLPVLNDVAFLVQVAKGSVQKLNVLHTPHISRGEIPEQLRRMIVHSYLLDHILQSMYSELFFPKENRRCVQSGNEFHPPWIQHPVRTVEIPARLGCPEHQNRGLLLLLSIKVIWTQHTFGVYNRPNCYLFDF